MAIVDRGIIHRSTSKMLNKKVELEGYVFDSMREAERWRELRIQQKAGLIRDLQVHPTFPLVVNEIKIGTYEADFSYLNLSASKEEAWLIVEDVKSRPTRGRRKRFSTKTTLYQWKKRLMLAILGIKIKEIE